MYTKTILLSLISLSIGLLGCKKSDIEIDEVENSDLITIGSESAALQPILHKKFSQDLTEEELDEKWAEAVAEYNRKTALQKTSDHEVKGPVVQISTRTGTKKYDATDSGVQSTIYFSDGNDRYKVHANLNNPGDDREKGDVDRYLFHLGHQVNTSLRFTKFTLAMTGNDGWGIEYYQVLSTYQMQEHTYPFAISCEPSVSIGNNNYPGSCDFSGYTSVSKNSRVFIDKNNSNYSSATTSTSSSGILTRNSNGVIF